MMARRFARRRVLEGQGAQGSASILAKPQKAGNSSRSHPGDASMNQAYAFIWSRRTFAILDHGKTKGYRMLNSLWKCDSSRNWGGVARPSTKAQRAGLGLSAGGGGGKKK